MANELRKTYAVSQGPLKLTIIIGDAQLGSSRVVLGDKELARGEIKDLPIGDGSVIAGKTLFIKSVVTDVNDKTNHTSITYVLRGGKEDKEYVLSEDVGKEGGSMIYRATFDLRS